MERIKNVIDQKVGTLRQEVEDWKERSEAAEAKHKEYELVISNLEEDKAALRLLAEMADERAEKSQKDTREAVQRLQGAKAQNETLQRELAAVISDRDLWQKKYD
ncbi:hypothetical protein FRC01_004263, partial [Tulasnella sp. 417]